LTEWDRKSLQLM